MYLAFLSSILIWLFSGLPVVCYYYHEVILVWILIMCGGKKIC